MSDRERELERRIEEILKWGVVCEVRHEAGLCRLSFGERVSPLAPWMMARCGYDRAYWHPDIGEQGCFFSPYGDGSEGFVMVGILSNRFPLPDGAGEDIRVTEYGDGTRVMIDRKNHVCDITDSYGSSIRLEGGNIWLKPAIKIRIVKGGKG